MTRDVLKALDEPTLLAVRCPGDGWPRNLLSETPVPDNWLALLLKPDGRRRIVPSGEDPRPEREDALLLVRKRPITVALSVPDLPSADGHLVTGVIELLVRWQPRDDELGALHKNLMSADELSQTGLTQALHEAGARTALNRFVRDHAAAALVRGDARAALLAWLQRELQRFLFSAGLTLERLGGVEFTSESLDRHEALQRSTARRVQELEARDLVERTARAATHRRLDELGSVLLKLKQAATADSTLQWRELLPSLTPGERGRLLENLWRLTPDRRIGQAIVVVAGRECAWLDPRRPDELANRTELPDDFGGLRSASYDAAENTLLIGASSGVWRITADDGRVVARYAASSPEPPRTGFNAATIAAGRLFATHSQLGAWSWSLDNPEHTHLLLHPIGGVPKAVRAVTVDDHGRVLLAADNRVHAFSPTGESIWNSSPADGAILGLTPLEDHLYAVTSEGSVLRCELKLPGDWLVLHRALAPIESIVARRWDDLVELVIPAGRAGVQGVYAEEGIVSRLLDSALPIRRAWACDDVLVGLSEHRDRLLVLGAESPGRAPHEAPLARLLGRTIQDVCIVTRRADRAPHPPAAASAAKFDVEAGHGANPDSATGEESEGNEA